MEVELNVAGLARIYGLGRLGFLTMTFADEVREIGEASRRFNSLRVHALDGRYETWVAIVERTKKGRVHLHLVVVCPEDIRAGFDFAAVSRRDYRSAAPYIRGEWAFWRGCSPRFGFGRCELLPIRTDADRFGRYLAKYLVKQFGTRKAEDKGARLVRYAQNFPRTVCGEFSPLARGQTVERRLAGAALLWGLSSPEALKREMGRAWRWRLGPVLYGPEGRANWIAANVFAGRQVSGGWHMLIRDALSDWEAFEQSLSPDERGTLT